MQRVHKTQLRGERFVEEDVEHVVADDRKLSKDATNVLLGDWRKSTSEMAHLARAFQQDLGLTTDVELAKVRHRSTVSRNTRDTADIAHNDVAHLWEAKQRGYNMELDLNARKLQQLTGQEMDDLSLMHKEVDTIGMKQSSGRESLAADLDAASTLRA